MALDRTKTRVVVPTCQTEERMLDFLTEESGLSRADVIRQCIRAEFERKTENTLDLMLRSAKVRALAVAASQCHRSGHDRIKRGER